MRQQRQLHSTIKRRQQHFPKQPVVYTPSVYSPLNLPETLQDIGFLPAVEVRGVHLVHRRVDLSAAAVRRRFYSRKICREEEEEAGQRGRSAK